jgi:hypothetical protein
MTKKQQKNNELRNHKIEQHEPHWNRGEFRCSGEVSTSCTTRDTRRDTVVTHQVISHCLLDIKHQ